MLALHCKERFSYVSPLSFKPSMAASSWAVCLLLTVSFTPFNLPLMLYARSFQLLFSPIDTSTTYFMVFNNVPISGIKTCLSYLLLL